MAETQTNKKTVRNNSKATATTIHDLYTDALVSIFNFGELLEMWTQRLTCARWSAAVSVALLRVTAYKFDDSHCVRQVVDLCPNLAIVCFNNPSPEVFKTSLDILPKTLKEAFCCNLIFLI